MLFLCYLDYFFSIKITNELNESANNNNNKNIKNNLINFI